MSDIAQESSPARFINVIEANLSAWIPVFGLLGQVHDHNPPGVKRAITDIASPLFNSVMDARLAPEQVDAAIQVVVSDARSRGVPILWWIDPSSQPADLGTQLEKYGFILEGEDPGMAVDLENLDVSLPTPAGFSIQHAQDDAAIRQWTLVMRSGFEIASPNEPVVQAWCSLIRQAGLETARAYTGLLNGEPVATSLLFLGGGVAGIYAVATIPEARRKGIGAWMTLHPLLEARAMGYKIGVLQASEMGFKVYRSLGLQEYCKISDYYWEPERRV